MNLFEDVIDKAKNWLPHGGTVNYYGKLFSPEEADYYFDTLMNTIAWRNDEAVIFGKKVVTKRKVAWYGEKRFEYTYSNITKYIPISPNTLYRGQRNCWHLSALSKTKQARHLIPVCSICTITAKKAWHGTATGKPI
ncbi:alpha-ketoglutarate-dependent dioxygenase AlkB family protein [Hanamia caeni]|uniref:hypothetical protein n=1 Tax=Hanamia caeni TaxID=2294116 RepID=UPI001F440EF3|nr:hypothetical protein [Hanamia caeni]